MENVRSVNCGGFVTTVVKTDSSLWVWGFNASGQMANGTAGWDTYKTPCKVMDNVVSVSNNSDVSAAVKRMVHFGCGAKMTAEMSATDIVGRFTLRRVSRTS